MKHSLFTILVLFFTVAVPVLAGGLSAQTPASPPGNAHAAMTGGALSTDSQSAEALRAAMRKLWEEHIAYTRNYIISGLAGLDDSGKVAERLLRNQDDIGNAIQPFYGDEAGKKLSGLLRDHILIAADIVSAAKAGNNDMVSKGDKKWHGNADDIATFLSGANPNWPKAALTDMLYKHLDFTTAEVVSRLKKDWAADIEAYDKGHDHMIMFADELTNGIVKQFPEKFSK